MLSQTTEYALRAVVWLAGHTKGPLTTSEIARATQSPAGYLSKVMKDLADAGIVAAQRGKNGGFTLAKPARDLTILEVVEAVDPIRRIHECPLGRKAHGKALCPLHRRLDDALRITEQAFRDTRIAELCEPEIGSGDRCRTLEASYV